MTSQINSETLPFEELSSYHQQLAEKFKNVNPDDISPNPDAIALTAFNGYYSLTQGGSAGAFFTIDTNIHITNGSKTPIYDVALLVSLDGVTSTRFAFTGTFDGTTLTQQSNAEEGLNAELTFAHTDGADGTTASIHGSITLPNQSPVTIAGNTYNNPIPYSVYEGKYYQQAPLHLSPSNKIETPMLVMQIAENYQLSYDYGSNDGILKSVPSYTYNLNMYFFSFLQGTDQVKLIMGSAAAGGLACNNMKVVGQKVTTRSLQTVAIPTMATDSPSLNFEQSAELASFSGYYLLPTIGAGAFISIEGQYVNEIGEDYIIIIGVSKDGQNSNGYYFDSSMKFENGVLTMPDQNISFTFNRGYNAENKSLVSITGSIFGQTNVKGYTPFNPVPLTGFKSLPMTTSAKDIKLTVVSDNELIYEGKQITTDIKKILYVPIMYILAYPPTNPTTVMSFGTDGLKGNTCIITDNNGIYVVAAIPKTS